jgi:hypothetical protein
LAELDFRFLRVRTSIANIGSLETAKFQLIMSTSEDPLDDSMADFLDELGAPESPTKSATATAELIETLLEDTTNTDILDSPQKERRDSVTKEIPKAAMAKEISRTTSPKVNMKQKITVSSSVNKQNKSKPSARAKAKQQVTAASSNPPPKSNVSKSFATPTRGGLTMYERSMLQMEEREQKLKALQDKLSLDLTFMPNSTSGPHSKTSTPNTGGTSDGGVGGMNVFSRLYHSETKAIKNQPHPKGLNGGTTPRSQALPRSGSKSRSRSRSNGSMRSTNTKSSSGTTRVEEMHERGQQSLRCQYKSDKKEEQGRRRRLEEELLGQCTFQPKTKWNLGEERRKMAHEVAGRAIPSPSDEKREKLSVSFLEEIYTCLVSDL